MDFLINVSNGSQSWLHTQTRKYHRKHQKESEAMGKSIDFLASFYPNFQNNYSTDQIAGKR